MARTRTAAVSDEDSATKRTEETSCTQLEDSSSVAPKRIDGDEPTSTTEFSLCSDYSESNDSWVVSQKSPEVSSKKKKEKKLEKKSRRGLLERIPSVKGALLVSSPTSTSKKSNGDSLGGSKSDHVSPSISSGGSRRKPLLRSLSAKKLLGLGSDLEHGSGSKKSKKQSKKESKKKRKDSGLLSKSDHGASSLVDSIATSRSLAWKEKVRPAVQKGDEALGGSSPKPTRSKPRRHRSFGEEDEDDEDDHEALYLPKNALITDCLKAYDRILDDYDDSTRQKRTAVPSPNALLEADLDAYNNILRDFRDSTMFDSTRLSEAIVQEVQAAPDASSAEPRKMVRDEGSSKTSNPLLESSFDDYKNILREFRDSTMMDSAVMSKELFGSLNDDGETPFAESQSIRSTASRMASKTGGSNWEI